MTYDLWLIVTFQTTCSSDESKGEPTLSTAGPLRGCYSIWVVDFCHVHTNSLKLHIKYLWLSNKKKTQTNFKLRKPFWCPGAITPGCVRQDSKSHPFFLFNSHAEMSVWKCQKLIRIKRLDVWQQFNMKQKWIWTNLKQFLQEIIKTALPINRKNKFNIKNGYVKPPFIVGEK